MPSYLTQVYATKTLEVSVLTGAVASSPLEAQIRAHILEGNQAFFKRHYPKALSHYLAAWGLASHGSSASSSRRLWD